MTGLGGTSFAALAAAALLAAAPHAGAQALVSYDTFPATYIAPSKWYGDEGRTYGGVRTEAHRSVVTGQARIELRAWGDTTNNTGLSSGRNSLIAIKSPNITAMRGTITMRSFSMAACTSNPSQPTLVRARLFGFFFNAGDAIPGSNFNDVFAGVQVFRATNSTDPVNTFRASAFIGVCSDDNCIGSTGLGSLDLGTVALNAPVALEMRWDPANNRFSFQRDAQAQVFLPYTLADAQIASFPVKRMEISNIVPHCLGGARPSAIAAADFDNIFVNAGGTAALRTPAEAYPLDAFERIDPLTGPLN